MKRVCLSFSDWVFETYLMNYKGNKSRFIEGLFVAGFENSLSDVKNVKTQLLDLTSKNRNLEEEISKLKFSVGSLKEKLSRKKRVMTPAESMAKTIKDGGLMNY